MYKQNLDETEVQKRVAALKRLKTLLEQQREKFRSYLSLLEQQQHSIMQEKTDIMSEYTDMGQTIVSELFTMQKIIDPLAGLYASVQGSASQYGIPQLQIDLNHLQEQVMEQNAKNRELLEARMIDLGQRISAARHRYSPATNVYADASDCGTLINLNL